MFLLILITILLVIIIVGLLNVDYNLANILKILKEKQQLNNGEKK